MTEEKAVKVILLGPSLVGKSSIVGYIMSHSFEQDRKPTIGVSFFNHFVKLANNETIRLQIWDTAGDERYRAVAPIYYRDANVVLLAYAMNDRETFSQVQSWYNEINQQMEIKPLIFIVENKKDLIDECAVSEEDKAQLFQDIPEATFFSVSAKTGEAIDDLFTTVAAKAYEQHHTRITHQKADVANTNSSDHTQQSKKCC